jgi:hypothetical protein
LYKFILSLYLYWFSKLSNNYIYVHKQNKLLFLNYVELINIKNFNFKNMNYFQKIIFTSTDKIYEETYELYLWNTNIISFFFFLWGL